MANPPSCPTSGGQQFGLKEPCHIAGACHSVIRGNQAFGRDTFCGQDLVIGGGLVSAAGAAHIQEACVVHVVIAQCGGAVRVHGCFLLSGLIGYRGRRFRAFCRFCGVRRPTSGPECHRCRQFVALPRWITKGRPERGGHANRSPKENEERRRDRVNTRQRAPLAARSAVIRSAF